MAFLDRSKGREARQARRFGAVAVGDRAADRATDRALGGPHAPLLRLAPRAALSLGLSWALLWLLADRFSHIDAQALANAIWLLSPSQWGQSIGLTALSFWAVGRYDAVLHRHFMTDIPERLARRAGIAAIAVSQVLGLGLISGAILRWRMLPGFTLWQATRLTTAVALSFLAGWAVVTSTTLLILPNAPFKPWAALGLALALGLAILSILAPKRTTLPFRWPNGFVMGRLVGLCATDTLTAALALYVLMPIGSDLSFSALLPAFLLALGVGLALGTPGGMGAFEVTLLALLPRTEEAGLLVAILGWRLVYYALPALAGGALALFAPPQPGDALRPPQTPLTAPAFSDQELADLPAETGLRHQGSLTLARFGGMGWLIGRQGHVLIALLDPRPPYSRRIIDTTLRGLRRLAHKEGRSFAAYKIGARTAACARTQGFVARRIGWEAWVSPSRYRISTSSRSGLRRKLRRAEAAGVVIRQPLAAQVPWPALDRFAAEWAQHHGGERGFSMGRHDRAYLTQQRLYVAWHHDRPIAYASFHTTASEWALDLMRHGKDLPDGTMHSLVQAAIDDATAQGVARLSLAAVPEGAFGPGDLVTRLIAALAPETAASGLLRFKSCFAPHWSPLYLVAPGCVGLALAGLSLWRAITRPPAIPRKIEQDDAEYGFASRPGPWHIPRKTD